MTIELTKTNEAIVAKMIKSNKSYTAIRNAMLALDMVDSPESADEYLAEHANVKKGRRGFVDSLYGYLATAPRTQAEMYDFIRQNASEKAWNWRKNHDKVRELTVRLHVDLTGCEFAEELYSEPQEEAQDAA